MISTSAAYQAALAADNRTFKARFLYNGIEVDGDIRSLATYKGSCGSDAFSLGSLFAPYIEAVVDGSTLAFENKELLLQMGIVLSDSSVEYANMGYFTVSKPSSTTKRTTFVAYGRLSAKCSGLYVSSLTFPATVQAVLDEISTQTGLAITVRGFVTTGTIATEPTGLQHYAALQAVAGVLGGFVTEDSNGGIVISAYPSAYTAQIDGDSCTTEPEFYDDAYTLDGIKCTVSDGGTTDDGTDVAEVSYTWGTGRLEYDNAYMTQALFDSMTATVGGKSYHPGDILMAKGDPRLEPWDMVEYDNGAGKTYDVPCMALVFTYDGGLQTEVIAPGMSDTESETYVAGALSDQVAQTYTELILAKQMIAQRITADEADIRYAKMGKIEGTNGWIDLASGTFNYGSGKLVWDGTVLSMAGTITATSGSIGGMTLSASSIYSGTSSMSSTAAGIYLGTDGFRQYTSASAYVNMASGVLTAKGANISGTITASAGTIGGMTLSGSAIYYGTSSMTSTTAGIYLGTGGFRQYSSASTYVNIASGVLTAYGASLSGSLTTAALTATGGTIGGWTINSSAIYKTSASWGTAGGMYFGSSGLSIGSAFTVDASGNLTATSGTFTGSVTSSSVIAGVVAATLISNVTNAQNAATSAQTTADGKNTVYYSSAQPTGGTYKANDIWFDTSNGYAMYVYSGSAWVLSQFSTNAIAVGAITANNIAAGAVTTAKIAAGAITAASAILANAAVTTAKIADAAITSAKIADASITSADIASATITGANIAAATIGTTNIADAAITNAKIGAVDAGKITTGQLAAARIDVTGLFAVDVTAANTITAPLLKSSDYSYSSGDYSTAGMMVDLRNNLIRSPYFSLSSTGGKFKGDITGATGTFSGTIEADAINITSKAYRTNDNFDITTQLKQVYGDSHTQNLMRVLLDCTNVDKSINWEGYLDISPEEIDIWNTYTDNNANTTSSSIITLSNKVGSSTNILMQVTDATGALSSLRQYSGYLSFDKQFRAIVPSGTAPIVVSSSTVCPNLNADMVDGYKLNQPLQTANSPTFAGLTVTGSISAGSISAGNIQTGTQSCACTQNTVTTTAVTFPKAFSSTPKVIVNPKTSVPQNVSCAVSGITTTGFTIYIRRTDTTTPTGVDWIAIS